MRPRDPEQPHRAATVLELFFDLVFVVAVSTAGMQLHYALTEGHAGKGIGLYLMVFFTIWWAWMNFTWFATSFDSDDWLYRLSTFVQMAGVLVLTAGIGDVFEDRNFSIMAIGYVIMRVAMGAQWLRASRAKGREGRSALTYAIGILSAQVLWVIAAVVTSGRIPLWVFLVLVIVELSVPLIAEVTGGTPWHREHIAERYGLFTIIVLGESLLGSANAIIEALVDYVTGSSELSYVAVSLTATVPVAVFILAIWAVAYPGTPRIVRTVIPIGAVVTVASTWVPVPIAGVAVVIVAMVVVLVCNPVDGDDDTEHEHKADAKEVNEVRN
ncbi:low temperature requirement protein A [Corynebacterium kroppenstedtii]|jgi:bacterial low temperature requirement A protein (ltrA)|uniref:Low temperature requirement protein A n=1 Tax=Corynebacterium kroppenstedtii TaxID=161879 RepID=A0A2W5SS94_9CORY|nr:low temperature requirement protein A [Corynebacterium kroppenstedtii]PZR06179.1 MAG: low temperature requirement protein A [Corynebacterium kroppenstedtii]